MNLRTLHLEHIWLLAVYSVATIANSRLQRGLRGIHAFSLYNVLALLGAIAVGLRGTIPDFLSIVGGDVFVIAAYLLLFASTSRTFSFGRRQTILAGVLFLAGATTMLLYGSIAPNTAKRLLAYSLVLALQQMQIAALLLNGRDRRRREVSWMLGAMLLALAATNTVRLAILMHSGAPDDYLRSGFALSSIVLANTCLQCGVVVAYIWMTTAMLRRDLELQASTDPLTGLLNRRALEAAAERAVKSRQADASPLCALAIDLDNYKRINDQLGHAAGDAALLAVSRCLEGLLRRGDLLARTGGDEFIALLPGTSASTALDFAETLRGCLQHLELGLADESLQITASFGIAETGGAEAWDQLLQRCDSALYEAKRSGGNRVFCNEAQEAVESSFAPCEAGHPLRSTPLDMQSNSA